MKLPPKINEDWKLVIEQILANPNVLFELRLDQILDLIEVLRLELAERRIRAQHEGENDEEV